MDVTSRDDVDPRLIRRAQRGHRRSQSVLVQGLQDVWYRTCLAQLRNPETARDATQETALRFLRGLAGFRGDSRLKTWSLGIAINVCRELQRTRHQTQPSLQLVASEAPAPDAWMLRDEQSSQLHRLLEQLPARQREAVTLRYFEHLSLAEVAMAMECAIGTAKATLSQALNRLRQELGETKP